jgi:hypothetical protein
MSVLDVLSVRDLVALTVIATRSMTMELRHDPDPALALEARVTQAETLVDEAFRVADAFVTASEGRWATGARANHQARVEERERDESKRDDDKRRDDRRK